MENIIGKWYFYSLIITCTDYYEENSVSEVRDVVFIPGNGSIAKHLLKEVKSKTFTFEQRGLPQYSTCAIRELSLLLPDGQVITGFKPRSISAFFSSGDE